MATPTQGPWRAVRLREAYIVVTERNHPAEVHDVANVPDIDIGHTEANARLIAAAPDLLEACRMVLDDPGLTAHACDVIRSALKKATERTNP